MIARLTVANIGKYPADEVVQLYVRKEASRVRQPISRLKGFTRVNLNPGETKEVKFIVNCEELRIYDVISESMLLEDGEYTFLAGASSRDIRQKAVICLEGEKTGVRSPWEVTAAVRYDDYDNCFIHKGTDGFTCVIPGKAGDNPDMPEHTSGQKATGELLYHDFLFDRNPCEMILNIYALEEGSMRISFCAQGMEMKSLTIQISKGRAFEDISMSFPSGFRVPEEPCTLKIETQGKIKLCRFFFR